MKPSALPRTLVPAALLLLAACGGGGGGEGETVAPTAALVSPAASGITDAEGFVVHGTTTAGSEPITDVRITDFATTRSVNTSDGFATWSVTMRPSPSSSFYRIEIDAGGVTTEVSTNVRVKGETPLLVDPVAVDVDPATGELYVLDLGRQELLLVDPTDGDRKILSGPTVGGGPVFDVAADFVLDVLNRRAFVFELGTGSVLEVSLVDGDREQVVKSTPGGPVSLAGIRQVAPGRHADELLVLASDGLIAVDLSTGMLTLISDDEPALGPPLVSPRGLAVDLAKGLAYVTDANTDSVLLIDIASGKRAMLSQDGVAPGPRFESPSRCTFDPVMGLLVVDELGTLVAVDPVSGARSEVSGGPFGDGDSFALPIDVVTLGGTAWVADFERNRLIEVDLATGDRVSLADGSVGSGPQLVSVVDMALDPSSGRVIAADLTGGEPQLVRITPSISARSVLASSTVGSGELFSTIGKLDVQPDLGLVLLVDVDGRVLLVNDVSGARTLELEADGTTILGIQTVAWLGEGTRHFLFTDGLADELRLYDRISDTSTTVASGFGGPIDLQVIGEKAYLATAEALWVVDLDTNDVVAVSSSSFSVGSGEPIGEIVRIAVDREGKVAYLRDIDLNQILAVDLETGERTLVSGATRGDGPPIRFGGAIALSEDGRTIFAHDVDAAQVLGVNVTTGDRVVVAR